MAKLAEELAEAKAITEREVSIRDGTCSHINNFHHYFKLPVIFGRLLKRQTDVAYTEWLSQGCLLSFALTSCSSLVSSTVNSFPQRN